MTCRARPFAFGPPAGGRRSVSARRGGCRKTGGSPVLVTFEVDDIDRAGQGLGRDTPGLAQEVIDAGPVERRPGWLADVAGYPSLTSRSVGRAEPSRSRQACSRLPADPTETAACTPFISRNSRSRPVMGVASSPAPMASRAKR